MTRGGVARDEDGIEYNWLWVGFGCRRLRLEFGGWRLEVEDKNVKCGIKGRLYVSIQRGDIEERGKGMETSMSLYIEKCSVSQ